MTRQDIHPLFYKVVILFFMLSALTQCTFMSPVENFENRTEQKDTDTISPALTATSLPIAATMNIGLHPTPNLREDVDADIHILRGINLGNALEAPIPGDWGVTIKEAYFQTIREAGFNAVRIPVCFSEHLGRGPEYLINNIFFNQVDEVIAWGLESGLIVILELHNFPELMANPIDEKEKFLAIWKQISERYQHMPPTLFFELLNEPHQNLDSQLWNQLIKDSIHLVREKNENRKILIEGVNYSDYASLSMLDLPKDDNLIATFHFYDPFDFTHQGASWVAGSSAWLGTTWQGTQSEKQEITQMLDLVVSWSNSHQIPLIMGEFGVINKADPTSRVNWIQTIAFEAEKRNISWFYWGFCSNFGIYDCQNETWDVKALESLFYP